MPGYALEIPSEPEELIGDCQSCFLQMPLGFANRKRVHQTGELKKLSPPVKVAELLKHSGEVFCAVKYLNTLQDVLTSSSYLKQHKPY